MSFLLVCIIAVVAALAYLITSPTDRARTNWSELARIAFAAAVFAILFAFALGTHDAIIRVTR